MERTSHTQKFICTQKPNGRRRIVLWALLFVQHNNPTLGKYIPKAAKKRHEKQHCSPSNLPVSALLLFSQPLQQLADEDGDDDGDEELWEHDLETVQ